MLAVAILAVPRLCLAQDDRSDDPPKRPTKGQTGGAVGTTGVGTPAAVGTTGVTPGTGPTPTPVTATTTPITGLFKEPELLTSGLNYAIKKFDADDQKSKTGWYLELSNMITGSGWISAGPGYRHWLWDEKAFYDASAAVSWHTYTMAQTRFEAPDLTKQHIRLGVQAMYQDQTQINYFGIGPNSPDLQSQYQLKSTDTVGYASIEPWTYWTISGEAGYLFNPKVSSPAGTFKPNVPTTPDAFPLDPGTQLSRPAELRPRAGRDHR